MKYTVKFKYDGGDVVTLKKYPPYNQLSYGHKRSHEFVPKQYKISGLKFVADEEGTKVMYRLYAYCDDYLDYHNWLTEDYIEGEGTERVEELDFSGIRGTDIQIGDTVYADIYNGSKDNHYVYPYLTFTRKGTVLGYLYENEITFFVDGKKCEQQRSSIMCDFYYPECWVNRNGTESAWGVVKNIDDDFIADYVKGCKWHRFNPEKKKDEERAKGWLELWGIYDKVCELYKKRPQPKKKPKTLKIDKIEKKTVVKNCSGYKVAEEVRAMLAGMSEEEKAEMLKQLTEKS